MNYLFYVGLVMGIMFLYTYPTITVSILFEYLPRRLGSNFLFDVSFYMARIVRAYLVVSVLLTFAEFYISSGLSPILILLISYFGLTFLWMIETTGARDNYYEDRGFQFAYKAHKIIWGIYTGLFFMMYFLNIPPEPYLSKLLLSIIVTAADYILFKFAVILLGAFFLLGFMIIFIDSLLGEEEEEKNQA